PHLACTAPPATTALYPLPLHDALPILPPRPAQPDWPTCIPPWSWPNRPPPARQRTRPKPTSSKLSPISPTRRQATATGHTTTTPDRKSTRLNSSHVKISYAVFCLKKKT